MNTTSTDISVSADEMMVESKKVLEELHRKGEEIGYKKAVVVGLSGDLGSGKTTFSQGVAASLGIAEQVTSPTFVIEKIYKTRDNGKFETFIHIDAYRLENGKELAALGLAEILNAPNTLIFIEWPEKVADMMPLDIQTIKFEFLDDKTRRISY
jgi:tRNA threonylcarbamoyladenosine biosynthesis protein TsaE